MKHSAEINELAAALAKAQGAMTNAELNKTNPHFKSGYADFTAIREATAPALSANGLAILTSTGFDDTGNFALVATMMHSSGQWWESRFPLPQAFDKPQVIGSAITYGRRYTWQALCGIGAEMDDDGNAANAAAATNGSTAPVQQRVTPKAPVAPHEISANGAAPWADAFIAAINTADVATLDQWIAVNKGKIGKLHDVALEHWRRVDAMILERRRVLTRPAPSPAQVEHDADGVIWDDPLPTDAQEQFAQWVRDLHGAMGGCEDLTSIAEKQNAIMAPMRATATDRDWHEAERIVSEAVDRVRKDAVAEAKRG